MFYGLWVKISEFRVRDFGFRLRVLGIKARALGFRVTALWFRIRGSGFRVRDLWVNTPPWVPITAYVMLSCSPLPQQ